MLSYTTGSLGKGWVYGLNTALDEIGATIGPLVIALVLFMGGEYRQGYALLLVPTVLAFVALASAALFIGAGTSIGGIWSIANSRLVAANAAAK